MDFSVIETYFPPSNIHRNLSMLILKAKKLSYKLNHSFTSIFLKAPKDKSETFIKKSKVHEFVRIFGKIYFPEDLFGSVKYLEKYLSNLKILIGAGKVKSLGLQKWL